MYIISPIICNLYSFIAFQTLCLSVLTLPLALIHFLDLKEEYVVKFYIYSNLLSFIKCVQLDCIALQHTDFQQEKH